MDKARQSAHPRNPTDLDDFEALIGNAHPDYHKNYQEMVKDNEGNNIGIMFGQKDLLDALKDKKNISLRWYFLRSTIDVLSTLHNLFCDERAFFSCPICIVKWENDCNL